MISLIAVTLFGLLPALRASGARSLTSLIGSPRTSPGRSQRLRGALVVSQLALSVVLLVGATLFVRSLLLERASDVGFDPKNRAVLSVNVGLQGYDEARGRRFYDDVLARLRALPQVAGATWAFPVPFDTYGHGITLYVDGVSTASKDGTFGASASMVAEDFVGAMGLRLSGGREFTTTDSAGAPGVMVVSRRFATRVWPGKNPIGQRARRGGASGPGRSRSLAWWTMRRTPAWVSRIRPTFICRSARAIVIGKRSSFTRAGTRRQCFLSCEAPLRRRIRHCPCSA